MSRFWMALGLAAVVATGAVGAQTTETKVRTKTKVEVKDGKDVTVTGCVERHPSDDGYVLTGVADKSRERADYMLVGDTDDLDGHVGHLVEIKGKAADRGKSKIKTEVETKVEREDGPDSEHEMKGEAKGEFPYLQVKDVKMLRPTCS